MTEKNQVAKFKGIVKQDGQRFDVWKGQDDGSLFVSKFCQDDLKPVPAEKMELVQEAV